MPFFLPQRCYNSRCFFSYANQVNTLSTFHLRLLSLSFCLRRRQLQWTKNKCISMSNEINFKKKSTIPIVDLFGTFREFKELKYLKIELPKCWKYTLWIQFRKVLAPVAYKTCPRMNGRKRGTKQTKMTQYFRLVLFTFQFVHYFCLFYVLRTHRKVENVCFHDFIFIRDLDLQVMQQ